jgi:anti-anti-sigma factor
VPSFDSSLNKPLPSAGGFSLTRRTNGGAGFVIEVEGEIDAASAAEFGEQLDRVIDGVQGEVVIDLYRCRFLDSGALQSLTDLARRRRDEDRTLALAALGSQPRSMFREAGLADSDLFLPHPEPPPDGN